VTIIFEGFKKQKHIRLDTKCSNLCYVVANMRDQAQH